MQMFSNLCDMVSMALLQAVTRGSGYEQEGDATEGIVLITRGSGIHVGLRMTTGSCDSVSSKMSAFSTSKQIMTAMRPCGVSKMPTSLPGSCCAILTFNPGYYVSLAALHQCGHARTAPSMVGFRLR